jgi:hypothetical protein
MSLNVRPRALGGWLVSASIIDGIAWAAFAYCVAWAVMR